MQLGGLDLNVSSHSSDICAAGRTMIHEIIKLLNTSGLHDTEQVLTV